MKMRVDLKGSGCSPQDPPQGFLGFYLPRIGFLTNVIAIIINEQHDVSELSLSNVF